MNKEALISKLIEMKGLSREAAEAIIEDFIVLGNIIVESFEKRKNAKPP